MYSKIELNGTLLKEINSQSIKLKKTVAYQIYNYERL